MNIGMDIHDAGGIKLVDHSKKNGTEWARVKIGGLTITVYDRASIDDALKLPRHAHFHSSIETECENCGEAMLIEDSAHPEYPLCQKCEDERVARETPALRAIYEGEKAAGLTMTADKRREQLTNAGRGHLLR